MTPKDKTPAAFEPPRLQVKATAEQLAAFSRAAKKRGLSRSAWVRLVLLEAAAAAVAKKAPTP